ncbi:MAG: hypothetical protein ING61_17360 [Rhodocyclaceae bacterium]|nr:hypothetical protein [Rhodocyclaceae bacterium]
MALLKGNEGINEQLILHELDIDPSGEETPKDYPADDDADEAILESGRQDFVGRVAAELEFRSRSAGASYPFSCELTRRGFLLTFTSPKDQETGKVVYLFCLLVTAYRLHIARLDRTAVKLDPHIGELFQVCACLAMGGYLQGDVFWLGWPRPERDKFLVALRRALERFGFGGCPTEIPAGFSSRAKDAGIDIIGWKKQPDGKPSTTLIIGQCASGSEDDKSVIPDMQKLSHWFNPRPFDKATAALFVPHPIYSDNEQTHLLRTEDSYRQYYVLRDAAFGIIFDRVRVSAFSDNGGDSSEVKGRVGELSAWVQSAISHLSEVGRAH